MRKKPLLFLLSGFLWGMKHKRDDLPAVILARYPQNANSGLIVGGHLRQIPLAICLPNAGCPLLLTTYFVGGNTGKIQWGDVEKTGKVNAVLEISHWWPMGKNTRVFSDDSAYKGERTFH